MRTVAPLGTWEDMIFSAEMDNAIKFGYRFEILWGYKFNRKNIFKGYVGTLYKLRLAFSKANPLNLISKLLLNSFMVDLEWKMIFQILLFLILSKNLKLDLKFIMKM
jgi:hypothetical protein